VAIDVGISAQLKGNAVKEKCRHCKKEIEPVNGWWWDEDDNYFCPSELTIHIPEE
jgi:hypothetical protein